jgi:hypothetical protein
MSLPFPAWLRKKHLDKWLRGYARHLAARAARRRAKGERHLLFALCDHHEPLWGGADLARGRARVAAWREAYPGFERFRDSDGRPPQHSFFYPGEQYAPELLEPLTELVRRGFGEVEVHLHHDADTAATLEPKLRATLRDLAAHGHLARDPDGRPRFAFIHGNWSLANARADGRWCGVDAELPLLHALGCYADFTFPAAPNECQPDIVNQIYWPAGDLTRRRAYEQGERARVGAPRRDRLLMIEGPLSFSVRARRLPIRIENGALDAGDPPTPARARAWIAQDIHVAGRPEWTFVKVHTHGAPEANAAVLLGQPMRDFHAWLTARGGGGAFALHYVTAREMYNIAMAAIDGKDGNPDRYRDHVLPRPPAAGG